MVNLNKFLTLVILAYIASCQHQNKQISSEPKKQEIVARNTDKIIEINNETSQDNQNQNPQQEALQPKTSEKIDYQLISQDQSPITKFVKGTHDVPLAYDLQLINNEEVDFDSIDGSFSSSSYRSQKPLNTIKVFYTENMPKLGWVIENQKEDAIIFARENQKLEIEFKKEENYSIAIFTLTIS